MALCEEEGRGEEKRKDGKERKTEENTFQKRMEEAMKEEIAERMRRMADLERMERADEVVQHYLELVQGSEEVGGPEQLFQLVKRAMFI